MRAQMALGVGPLANLHKAIEERFLTEFIGRPMSRDTLWAAEHAASQVVHEAGCKVEYAVYDANLRVIRVRFFYQGAKLQVDVGLDLR